MNILSAPILPMDLDERTDSLTLASLLVGIVALVLLVDASPAAAQYTPEESNRFTTTISIQGGGDRLTPENSNTGYIGVEECRELSDDDEFVTFRWQLVPNQTRSYTQIEYEQIRITEFSREEGRPSGCTHEDPSGCSRLNEPTDQNQATADVQLEPNPGAVFQPTSFEITADVRFNTLLAYDDGQEETCAFVDSGGGSSQDAGMAGDPGDAGLADAGNGSGEGTVSGDDHFYVSRLFLIGERGSVTGDPDEELIDAPLLLDRTRPPAPSNLRGAATENILKVRFAPPSDEEVDGYHVFYANESIGQNTTPEQLEELGNDERAPLRATSEQDNGEVTGEVTGIDQSVDDQLNFAVVSQDRADNFSELTRADESVTVQESIDFWEKYRDSGGSEPGGCACRQTDRAPLGLLVLVAGFAGLLVARRHLEPT